MADHALATITNPSAALTDFTLIVDLANLPASWWSAVTSSDGTKGRVYKGDGTTELAADWIDFDDTAETGLLRVKWSGTLATSGTQQLWIEPPLTGNASYAATDTYGSDNAYDANWEAYWPFESDYTDRTSNSADASAGGGTPTIASGGQIGVNELQLDVNEELSATISTLTNSQITILGWGKPGASSSALIGTAGGYEMVLRVNGGVTQFLLNSFSTNDRVDGSTSVNTSGVYQQFGGRYDGTDLEAFYNGSSDGSVTPTGSWGSISNLEIGALYGAADWLGAIDDLQIHSTGRSDAWIASEYAQTNDNSTFWGTWTWSGGGSPPAQSPVPIIMQMMDQFSGGTVWR